jgi:hypothetical protein
MSLKGSTGAVLVSKYACALTESGNDKRTNLPCDAHGSGWPNKSRVRHQISDSMLWRESRVFLGSTHLFTARLRYSPELLSVLLIGEDQSWALASEGIRAVPGCA